MHAPNYVANLGVKEEFLGVLTSLPSRIKSSKALSYGRFYWKATDDIFVHNDEKVVKCNGMRYIEYVISMDLGYKMVFMGIDIFVDIIGFNLQGNCDLL